MAIMQLKDVVVTKVHRSGFGLEVAEEFESGGQKRQKKFTVWFKEPSGLSEGDIVSLSGLYSDAVKSFENQQGETKYYVERSLNGPRLEASSKANTGWQDTAVRVLGATPVEESAPF